MLDEKTYKEREEMQRRSANADRRIAKLVSEGKELSEDEVEDIITEELYGDDKEYMEKYRTKKDLSYKAQKGLLSEKEIDNLILSYHGKADLKPDKDNNIDARNAEVNPEGVRRNQEHLKSRMEQYDSLETDDERTEFLNELKAGVYPPEVAERNTELREAREKSQPEMQKQAPTEQIPIEDQPII